MKMKGQHTRTCGWYVKKSELSQKNYLMIHLKILEEQEVIPKFLQTEIMKNRIGINEMETKQQQKESIKQRVDSLKS
jgi:hypothetical protein